MEQGASDSLIQIVAGLLFLTPIKMMFKRVLKRMQESKDESFWEYNFPTVIAWLNRKK